MIIAVTNLKLVTGAQMLIWQGANGFFIAPDTLLFEGDDAFAAMVTGKEVPDGSFRKATEAEIELWLTRQQVLLDSYTDRIDALVPEQAKSHWEELKQMAERHLKRLTALQPKHWEGALPFGTAVRTLTSSMTPAQEHSNFYPEAVKARRWGIEGVITEYHNSHGACYYVKHADGVVGCYKPSEIAPIKSITEVHLRDGWTAPIPKGTQVITTKSMGTPEQEAKHFTTHALKARVWGAKGVITQFHDGLKLFYIVQHEDGHTARYNVEEFEILN